MTMSAAAHADRQPRSQPVSRRQSVHLATRWLREPLLHFLILGVALFAVSAFRNSGASGSAPVAQIALTMDQLRQMEMSFEAQWQRPPTEAEFSALVDNTVREEVLYREALALGLDKDDTIVKRRMAQKMQFLAEDIATAREPTAAELKSWFEQHSAKFALPSRFSFRHLYFSPDRRGARAHDDAANALAQLAGQPEATALAAALADPFMFQDYYRDRAPDYIGKEFGPPFARAVEQLSPGAWQGPIESGFGWHLVYVDTVIPGRVPAFEEIESDVKTAWLAEQKALAREKAYKEIRAKYVVLVPAPPAEGSSPPAAPLSRDAIGAALSETTL